MRVACTILLVVSSVGTWTGFKHAVFCFGKGPTMISCYRVSLPDYFRLTHEAAGILRSCFKLKKTWCSYHTRKTMHRSCYSVVYTMLTYLSGGRSVCHNDDHQGTPRKEAPPPAKHTWQAEHLNQHRLDAFTTRTGEKNSKNLLKRTNRMETLAR